MAHPTPGRWAVELCPEQWALTVLLESGCALQFGSELVFVQDISEVMYLGDVE